MKKLFLRLYPLWFILLGMICFASCNDDEQEGGGTQTPPSLPSLGITDPVTAIGYGSDLSTFNYVDGRMVGGFDYGYQEADFTLAYSPLTIKGYYEEKASDYSYVYEIVYSNIHTNAMGCITSTDITMREYESSYGEEYVDEEILHCAAEYDSECHLTKMTMQNNYESSDGESYRWLETVSRVWRDGNLISERWTGVDYAGDADVTDEETVEEWTTFTYAENAPVNNGIYLDEMIIDSDLVTYAGFWGKPTRNIPTSVEYIEDDGRTNSVSYSVDTDEKGRIIVLYKDGRMSLRFGYADTPLATEYVQKIKSAKGRLFNRRLNKHRRINNN